MDTSRGASVAADPAEAAEAAGAAVAVLRRVRGPGRPLNREGRVGAAVVVVVGAGVVVVVVVVVVLVVVGVVASSVVDSASVVHASSSVVVVPSKSIASVGFISLFKFSPARYAYRSRATFSMAVMVVYSVVSCS